MSRSWNGSQEQANTSLEIGSFKDQRHDWRPSYLRTMPSSPQSRIQQHRKLDLTGEMIFGTAPLAYKGMNTKIHYYKREKNPQIILSKLFTLNNTIRRPSFASSLNSTTSEQSSDDDHYYYTPITLNNSHRKRSRKYNMTSMENGAFYPTPLPTISVSFFMICPPHYNNTNEFKVNYRE